MSVNLIVNGVSFAYPATGDQQWGSAATNWASAVTNGMLQKAGGTFTLTSDVNFGSSFGLISAYLKSISSNIAQSGVVRLAHGDAIAFRNAANNADLLIGVNSSNQFTFNGTYIPVSGAIVNADISPSAAIAYSKLNLAGSILNSDISGSAAIAYSKLALSGSILNSDISGSAAIAYSKLSLSNSIVNSDISSSAAIAYSKLNLAGSVNLASDMTGVLPVANGGTNSSTALSNNRFIVSSGGKIVEASAVSANKAVVSDSNGLPSASSTTATQIGYLSAASSNVHGDSDSATLTNKTFGDGPTFTQISTPSTPSSGFNKLYPKSDNKFYTLDSTGAERQVGSGAGVINYIAANPDAESGTTGWATYANTAQPTPVSGTGGSPTITLTASSSSPLRGSKSFLITKGASNCQGQGVSFDFTIDPADEANVLSISFNYNVASPFVPSSGQIGSVSDIAVFIYDKTNSILIPVSPNVITGLGSNNFNFAGIFQTSSNSTSYRLILHITSTNASAYSFEFDNVFCGPQPVLYGAPIGNWQAFTPTFNNLGTVTTISAYWRRVGGNIEVRGKFTSGTGTSSVSSMTLPPGLSVDGSQVDSVSNLVIGFNTTSANGSYTLVILAPTTTSNLVYFGIGESGAASGTPRLGNTMSSETDTFYYSVPVLGWSSNVEMSQDASTRVVAATYTMTSPDSPGSGNPINFNNEILDTHAAVTTGASWKFTAPVSGDYVMSIVHNGNSSGGVIFLYKNGSNTNINLSGTAGGDIIGGAVVVPLTAGDYVYAADNDGATYGQGTISIHRLSGPSVIAASETVAASYYVSSNTSITSSAQINYDTKILDTHGAVTTGASWKFTAPVSGLYQVGEHAQVSSTAASFIVYKNGSSYSYTTTHTTAGIFSGSTQLQLLAGDYIDIRPDTSTTIIGGSSPIVSQIDIRRVGNYS